MGRIPWNRQRPHCNRAQYEASSFLWPGSHTVVAESSLQSIQLLSAPINGSFVSACAQKLISSFLESILDILDDVGHVDLQETEPFRLQNGLVTEAVRLFAEMQLGSRQETLLCVLPLMISHLKQPSPASILAGKCSQATPKQRVEKYRRNATMGVENLHSISMSLADTPDEDGNPPGSKYALAELAMFTLGELYRWALVNKRIRHGRNLLARETEVWPLGIYVRCHS
jgi:hypothetical protein